MDEFTKEQGALELTLINAELCQEDFATLLMEGVNRGIPAEIMTRLESIWATTQVIAGEVIGIGKIVVSRIFAFLREHPAIGVGIAMAVAVNALIAGIPLLGMLLGPLIGKLSILYGAGVGATLDATGSLTSDPLVAVQHLAAKFFELLRAVFIAVTKYLQETA